MFSHLCRHIANTRYAFVFTLQNANLSNGIYENVYQCWQQETENEFERYRNSSNGSDERRYAMEYYERVGYPWWHKQPPA